MAEFLKRPRSRQPRFLRLLSTVVCWVLYPLLRLSGIRFLSMNIYNIGHLCTQPDCFIKERLLGSDPRATTRWVVLSTPTNRVANGHLLKYWRIYLPVISHPLICFFIYPLVQNKALQVDSFRYDHDHRNLGSNRIEALWGDRPPLLHLRKTDQVRGRAVLGRLGLPTDAWYVALHCRENGYTPKCTGKSTQQGLNASIANYLPAVEAIVDQGGWVVRMGDASMHPLPPMERVIDYACSEFKSEWLDVFLCAACRFMLASSSGLFRLATIFGVPAAVANISYPYLTCHPFGRDNIGILKRVRYRATGRCLPFGEIFGSDLALCVQDDDFAARGLELVENSSREICDLTEEMLDRLDGRLTYSASDQTRQVRFKTLLPDGFPAPQSQIGRSFLKKYEHLIS